MLQLLRFGCSWQAIADTTCSATTIRNRRDEWIQLDVFARFKQIARESYDRVGGLSGCCCAGVALAWCGGGAVLRAGDVALARSKSHPTDRQV